MDEHVLDSAFQRKYLPHWLYAGGVVLLIVSAVVWWTQVYTNPYNVYWGMLASNLAASSYTSHTAGDSSGTYIDQYTAQQFGANTLAYSQTTLTTSTNSVQTESVGTLANDFIRYTKIQTKQKTASGKPFDYSNVIGKWAKAPAPNIALSDSNSSAPLFSQSLLGIGGGNVFPIANMTVSQRSFLIGQLHQNNVFDTTFSNVKKSTLGGQPVYVYDVTVEPVAYVAFEKQFATELGLHTLDNYNPNDYASQQPFQVEISVNIHSHQLAEVSYVGTSHQVYYTSFGVPLNLKVPVATMSSQTLQNLIAQTQ